MKATLQRHAKARIDTRRPLTFQFDGRRYCGFEGDSLASALLANGVNIVGRSFKLHRPRGVIGHGKEEANALVQLEEGALTEPNVRATQVSLYDGLSARGQNAWPDVQFDLFGLLGLFKRLLPAGFYYKTFMWPGWGNWEWLVRRMAGLGKAPKAADPDVYLKQNLHADIVVVGAGRAGIQAALEAAESGAQVLLVDDQAEPGGALLASPLDSDSHWLDNALAQVAASENITFLPRTTVTGFFDNCVLSAVQFFEAAQDQGQTTARLRERLWRFFAGRVVLASGALERPMVFPDNDRPGIMLASAVREYTHRYGLTLGDHIVFYCNNDSAWQTAQGLVSLGVGVTAIVDTRETVDADLVEAAQAAGIALYLGASIVATRGRRGVRGVKLVRQVEGGSAAERLIGWLKCDLVAMSGGWNPNVHLFSQSGGALVYCDSRACLVPESSPQPIVATGRANGDFGDALHIQPEWFNRAASTERQWLDFQYDVTVSDIELAVRENLVSVEHVKRYTTNGMSVDQGKTSNVNALGVLAEAVGRPIPEVGTTRFRPPYHPTTLGAYAGVEIGALYHPWQQLPVHADHVAAGAVFEDYGAWRRPAYYPLANELEADTIAREAALVRKGVGILDYSPLGKLEVHGPDAREFLNRVYINNMMTLSVGAARYGIMLNEAGIVIDDGVAVCLAEDHFLLHTTSGGADTIQGHLEEWLQCEWPDLKVIVSNQTTQWATFMLSGPKSREVLQELDGDIDLSSQAFAHMQFRSGALLGQRCRILRASFTGEVSFEVSVPAKGAQALWGALMEAGKEFGMVPFGIESLMCLRTEKGYLHVGADTDGNTMPQDLGWARAIEKKPVDFIGRRSLDQAAGRDPSRLQFTGIELLSDSATTLSGAHVVTGPGGVSEGYVTSAFRSPALGRTVALGLVAGAGNRQGELVTLFYEGCTQPARLVEPTAYDPAGERLHG